MRLNTVHLLPSLMISAIVCGCATTSKVQENLDAVLWVQSSAEFVAATTSTYAAASTALKKIVADDPIRVDQMVVVMDVDETILDNSAYQAQSVLDNKDYQDESFDRFAARRETPAIPGSIDFIKSSRDMGVDVIFVTNRRCREREYSLGECPNKEDTLVNLRSLGIEVSSDALFFLGDQRPDRCRYLPPASDREQGRWIDSDKSYRRQCIELDHEIVMLIGDQLGDFVGGLENATPETRRLLVGEHKEKWGHTWFIVPGPTYGAWLRLLDPDKRSHLRGW